MEIIIHDLITSLENEIKFIENEINKCVENMEYADAELYKEALQHTERQLLNLKFIENPDYNKIIKLEKSIDWNEKYIANDSGEFPFRKERYLLQIAEFKEQLNNLYKQHDINIPTNIINETIIQLINAEFSLLVIGIIPDTINLNLEIVNKSLIIELEAIDEFRLKNFLSKQTKSILKKLGFEKINKRWNKQVSNFTPEDIPDLMQTLARISYDVFSIFGNQSINIIANK